MTYEYNTYHTYIIRADKRNMLQKHLFKNGIETKIHYPLPIHLQKASKKLKLRSSNLPNTERISREILTLPVNQYLKDRDISKIINSIKNFYKSK